MHVFHVNSFKYVTMLAITNIKAIITNVWVIYVIYIWPTAINILYVIDQMHMCKR